MAQQTERSTELKRGVIGVVPLAFLVIAAAAPLGATAANIPLIFGFGNGIAAPMDFFAIGVLLVLFAVGFTAMSSHVTNAGAFYTYISMGLGKRLGGACGYVAVAAYNLLTVYCGAVGGYFASYIIATETGIELPWMACTIVLYLLVFLLSYLGIEGGTKFLVVCLCLEVGVLAVMDISVLAQKGLGAYTLDSLSPQVFFSGAPGLGIAFAFLCFIGFEATAIFGEEAKDPRRTVPRATYVAVIFVGVVYAFSGWTAVAALGPDQVIAIAQGEDAADLFHSVISQFAGPVFGHIFNWLLIVSTFASWLAAHNMASRYLYAFGRAGMLPSYLATTQSKYKSPYTACLTQMAFGLIVTIGFGLAGFDPYSQIGAICSAVAVVGIMALELLVSAAVMRYLRSHNQEEGFHYNVFTTTIAPILSLIGMAYIAVLVISNFSLLTGLDNMVLNVLFGGLMLIVGVIGYIVSYMKDKKGTLADAASIEVE